MLEQQPYQTPRSSTSPPMTARKPPKMRMETRVDIKPDGMGGVIKTLASGGVMWAPFTAIFTSDRVRCTIAVDVADGRPVCRRYEVERIDDAADGLELMT